MHVLRNLIRQKFPNSTSKANLNKIDLFEPYFRETSIQQTIIFKLSNSG